MPVTAETPLPLNSYRTGPDERGHFGIFGGRYVAETLMPLILDLEAAYNQANAAVTYLLQHGFAVNDASPKGFAATELASGGAMSSDTLRTLLNAGAQVNHQDNDGMTALHWAARGKSGQHFDLLLQYGADPNIRDRTGKLPIDYVSDYNGDREELISMLEPRDRNLQFVRDNVGSEALTRMPNNTVWHGTVRSVSPDKRQMTMLVTDIVSASGDPVVLKTPRIAQVEFTEAGLFYAAAPPHNAQISSPNALLPGVPVACYGGSQGEGNALKSWMAVTLTAPGVNLVGPVTDEGSWKFCTLGDKVRVHRANDGEALHITVDAVDSIEWYILLIPAKPVPLINGAKYRVTFRARSDAQRSYGLQFKIDQPDWHDIVPFQRYNVGTDWQAYSFDITPQNVLDGHNAAPVFFLGKEPNSLYLADLKVTAVK